MSECVCRRSLEDQQFWTPPLPTLPLQHLININSTSLKCQLTTHTTHNEKVPFHNVTCEKKKRDYQDPFKTKEGNQGGKKIGLRGGDGTEAHFPNPPPPPWSPCRDNF